jgi:hypothetical protein
MARARGDAHPAALELICALMERLLRPEGLTLSQACGWHEPAACRWPAWGSAFLQGKVPRGEESTLLLLGLVEAESEPIRAELVRWARGVLAAGARFQADWVLSISTVAIATSAPRVGLAARGAEGTRRRGALAAPDGVAV